MKNISMLGHLVPFTQELTVLRDTVPQFVAIRTASLDDPSWFEPQMNVWTCDAHLWDDMNPALPKFEKYPQ
ncbi:MAG: hypothetical protein WAK31_04800 [Chthoniobacterales bacterium]